MILKSILMAYLANGPAQLHLPVCEQTMPCTSWQGRKFEIKDITRETVGIAQSSLARSSTRHPWFRGMNILNK